MKKYIFLLFVAFSLTSVAQVHKGFSSKQLRSTENKIINTLGRYPEIFTPYRSQSERKVKLDRISCSEGRVNLYFNDCLVQIGIREELCLKWENQIREILGNDYKDAKIGIFSNGMPIERFIPNIFRKKIARDTKRSIAPIATTPLVKSLDEVTFGKGLAYRTLAIWPSHGKYMDFTDTIWKFQRPALFTTIEDIHTFYLLDTYLIPMLENSGAVIITPRERDTNPKEIIIDNDSTPNLIELKGNWTKLEGGFKPIPIIRNENPFTLGTSLTANGLSTATYTSKIDSSGKYAIYVSYKADPKNSNKVQYTITHKGGQSRFEVNQTIGGGWIYLGKFEFNKEAKITLNGNGRISTDAIKIGGGMGNIERLGKLSNAPRWAEAARYFMQYSGVPESVYKQQHDTAKESDYMDDYKSRGDWVNYIKNSQKIPVDLSFALHTNAGRTDSIFGSLTIHYTNKGRDTYENGKSKFAGRDLADIILTQVVDDIKFLYDTTWVRRSIYDKSYAEVSRPDVPAVILELLSHQNYNDMSYGTDANFRFDVCRAIYKGILKFLSDRYSIKYDVQPLPVSNVDCRIINKTLRITWEATEDPLEPTAKPLYYIFHTLKDGIWDNGVRMDNEQIELEIPTNTTTYRITAYNEGGKSFDIHSFNYDPATKEIKSKRLPLVDYSVVGLQTDYNETSEFIDNNKPGYGASDLSLLFKGIITTY